MPVNASDAARIGDQAGTAATVRTSSSRWIFPSWATLPIVSFRRNVPSVDGARIPPSTSPSAPARSRCMSSRQSAPAAMPATRHQQVDEFGALLGQDVLESWSPVVAPAFEHSMFDGVVQPLGQDLA
nr:hypothetical protein [Frankia sp. Cr2]